MGAVSELRLDPDVKVEAVEPELPSCTKSDKKPINRVLKALLGMMEILLGVTEPWIGSQWREAAITRGVATFLF